MATELDRKNAEYWAIFRGWEIQLCLRKDPSRLMVDLMPELRQEWAAMNNKQRYAETLLELKESITDVEMERKGTGTTAVVRSNHFA